MPPQSYIQYYYSATGDSMCEIAFKSNGLNDDVGVISLGINFLENFLQVYDIKDHQVCLGEIDQKGRTYNPIPFPWAPEPHSKMTLVDGLIFAIVCLVVILAVSFTLWATAPPPGLIVIEDRDSATQTYRQKN